MYFRSTRLLTCCLGALFLVATSAGVLGAEPDTWNSPPAKPGGKVVFRVVMIEDEDGNPAAAGKEAAKQLLEAMGEVAPKVVVISECFEDRQYKEELLSGITSVLPQQIVLGGATYGSFTQQGCTDFDAVCLLGIGGEGVGVSATLVRELGTSKLVFEEHGAEIKRRLQAAGAKAVKQLRRSDNDKLLMLVADAHSPKNQFLVEGAQAVLGKQFAITGGSANKNAGQTFVYYRGRLHQDAAVAVMLSGDFRLAMAGRKAQDNDSVIRTAKEAAAEVLAGLDGKPAAVLAFNCAGRRGKLKKMEDELAAIQEALGKTVPMFGCYCAGEIGPLDAAERQEGIRCGGSGWHVMFTVIGR